MSYTEIKSEVLSEMIKHTENGVRLIRKFEEEQKKTYFITTKCNRRWFPMSYEKAEQEWERSDHHFFLGLRGGAVLQRCKELKALVKVSDTVMLHADDAALLDNPYGRWNLDDPRDNTHV